MTDNVILKVLVDDKLEYEIQDPKTKPTAGEFIDVPVGLESLGRFREVYVNKVINRYPRPSDPLGLTVVECQCASV